MSIAYFSYGYNRNGNRIEWWHVINDGVDQFVRITFDLVWFKKEGSINDIKQMAITASDFVVGP
jgi:hypothetical protein